MTGIFLSNSGNIVIFLIFPLLVLGSGFVSCVKAESVVQTRTESGLVSGVSAKNLVEVEWFEIESQDGTVTLFKVRGLIPGFTPSHFRHHMVTGQAVEVVYEIEAEDKIAVIVLDGSPSQQKLSP